jgi:hypothetical protein
MVWYEVNQWRERPEPPLLLQRPSHVASWLLTCRTVFPGASPKNLASSEQQTTEAASPTCKSVKRSITTSVCHICHGPSEVHHSSSILNILNAKAEKLRKMLRKLNGRSMSWHFLHVFLPSCQVTVHRAVHGFGTFHNELATVRDKDQASTEITWKIWKEIN